MTRTPARAPVRSSLGRNWLQRALGLGQWDPGPEFAWHGRVAFVCSVATLLAIACGAWVFKSAPPAVDFISFWAAARLAVGGHSALAYDYDVHRAVEMTAAHMGGRMPFSYPPPFLFALMPFSLPPVWLAFLLWVSITAGLYLVVTRRLLPAIYGLAQPPAFMNVVEGQNGFLTCSILIAGLSRLDKRPLLAGSILGLLVCKPQIGILVPIALIAGRYWRAIIGAAASTTFLLIAALLAFGVGSYAAFFTMARQYAVFVADGAWQWNQLASVFGFARFFGMSQSTSLVVQLVAALVAVLLAWRSWALKDDERVAILAAATLLVSPYLFTYDAILLVIPLASFLRDRARPWRVAVIWLLSLVAVMAVTHFSPVAMPNVTPLAAILALSWLHGDAFRAYTKRILHSGWASASAV